MTYPVRMKREDAKALLAQAGMDFGTELPPSSSASSAIGASAQKRPRNNEEEREQTLLFSRSREFEARFPALCRLFSTLNGVFIPRAMLRQVAATGLRKGVLDIWLPIRRIDADGTWSGLVIDLKRKKGGRPSPEQLEWAADLVANGYRAYFCAGALDAWRTICCYLGVTGAAHVAADLEELSDWLSRQTERNFADEAGAPA